MSAYKTFKTQMTDVGLIAMALEEVKPEWKGKIKVSPKGDLAIKGDSTKKGVLVVEKGAAKTYSDIGISVNKDGTLKWEISDVDTGDYFNDAATREAKGMLFGQKFLQDVQNMYALHEGVRDAVKGGAEIISGKTDVTDPQWGACIGVKGRIRRMAIVQA